MFCVEYTIIIAGGKGNAKNKNTHSKIIIESNN